MTKKILTLLLLLSMVLGFPVSTPVAFSDEMPEWVDESELEYEFFGTITGPARYTMRLDVNVEALQEDGPPLEDWEITVYATIDEIEIIEIEPGKWVMEIYAEYPGLYYFDVYAEIAETEWNESAIVSRSGALRIRKHEPSIGFEGCGNVEFDEHGNVYE